LLELELDEVPAPVPEVEESVPVPVVDEPVPVPEVDEPAPMPDVELEDDASAPGAGVGVGEVVVLLLLVEGEDAGGGVVTVLSSVLLQAVRPIATRATTRSEGFMIFSFTGHHTGLKKTNGGGSPVRERPTRSS
jgi:hypothetical protein